LFHEAEETVVALAKIKPPRGTRKRVPHGWCRESSQRSKDGDGLLQRQDLDAMAARG
jgi:hypothetical protein